MAGAITGERMRLQDSLSQKAWEYYCSSGVNKANAAAEFRKLKKEIEVVFEAAKYKLDSELEESADENKAAVRSKIGRLISQQMVIRREFASLKNASLWRFKQLPAGVKYGALGAGFGVLGGLFAVRASTFGWGTAVASTAAGILASLGIRRFMPDFFGVAAAESRLTNAENEYHEGNIQKSQNEILAAHRGLRVARRARSIFTTVAGGVAGFGAGYGTARFGADLLAGTGDALSYVLSGPAAIAESSFESAPAFSIDYTGSLIQHIETRGNGWFAVYDVKSSSGGPKVYFLNGAEQQISEVAIQTDGVRPVDIVAHYPTLTPETFQEMLGRGFALESGYANPSDLPPKPRVLSGFRAFGPGSEFSDRLIARTPSYQYVQSPGICLDDNVRTKAGPLIIYPYMSAEEFLANDKPGIEPDRRIDFHNLVSNSNAQELVSNLYDYTRVIDDPSGVAECNAHPRIEERGVYVEDNMLNAAGDALVGGVGPGPVPGTVGADIKLTAAVCPKFTLAPDPSLSAEKMSDEIGWRNDWFSSDLGFVNGGIIARIGGFEIALNGIEDESFKGQIMSELSSIEERMYGRGVDNYADVVLGKSGFLAGGDQRVANALAIAVGSFMMSEEKFVAKLPATAAFISEMTRTNPTLSQVIEFRPTPDGSPNDVLAGLLRVAEEKVAAAQDSAIALDPSITAAEPEVALPPLPDEIINPDYSSSAEEVFEISTRSAEAPIEIPVERPSESVTAVESVLAPASTREASAVLESLRTKGVVLYSAEWCGPCKMQKEIFGASLYSEGKPAFSIIECGSPDGSKTISGECREKGVRAIPTWKFPDGSTHEGVLSLEQLKRRLATLKG